MRSIAHALCDHLLIAGGQLAEPAAEGTCPRMRLAAVRAFLKMPHGRDRSV